MILAEAFGAPGWFWGWFCGCGVALQKYSNTNSEPASTSSVTSSTGVSSATTSPVISFSPSTEFNCCSNAFNCASISF